MSAYHYAVCNSLLSHITALLHSIMLHITVLLSIVYHAVCNSVMLHVTVLLSIVSLCCNSAMLHVTVLLNIACHAVCNSAVLHVTVLLSIVCHAVGNSAVLHVTVLCCRSEWGEGGDWPSTGPQLHTLDSPEASHARSRQHCRLWSLGEKVQRSVTVLGLTNASDLVWLY